MFLTYPLRSAENSEHGYYLGLLLEEQVKSLAELETLVFRASALGDRMLRGLFRKLLMSDADDKNAVGSDMTELRRKNEFG